MYTYPFLTDSEKGSQHEYMSIEKLHWKTVAAAFWTGEVQAEMRETGMRFSFGSAGDREVFMDEVDQSMPTQMTTVLKLCKKRGTCIQLYTWGTIITLQYFVLRRLWATVVHGRELETLLSCMYHVPKQVRGFQGSFKYVDTCPEVASFTGQLALWPGNKASPEAPVHGEAFCTTHCEEAAAVGIPTGLKDYIVYCGVKEVIRT